MKKGETGMDISSREIGRNIKDEAAENDGEELRQESRDSVPQSNINQKRNRLTDGRRVEDAAVGPLVIDSAGKCQRSLRP